jgi:hypothetical protein
VLITQTCSVTGPVKAQEDGKNYIMWSIQCSQGILSLRHTVFVLHCGEEKIAYMFVTLHHVSYGAKIYQVSFLIYISSVDEPLCQEQRNSIKVLKINEKQHFRCIPSLSITNDQFSLTSANGHQRIHSLDTCLHWLPHRDSGDDTRSLNTNSGPKRNMSRRK